MESAASKSPQAEALLSWHIMVGLMVFVHLLIFKRKGKEAIEEDLEEIWNMKSVCYKFKL